MFYLKVIIVTMSFFKGYLPSTIFFFFKMFELPLILAEGFNVNFEKDELMPLATFLQEEFQLQINNNPREYTARYWTIIDAVFIRYLNNVMSNT